jgi:hypothetical protein
MRIILSCLQSLRRHDIPAYDFWRTYFVEGCHEASIDVLEVPGVDWAEGLTHAGGSEELDLWRSRTWEQTLAFAKDEQERGGVDFFLGYLYPEQVDVSAVHELRRAGIPCVNFFCDNVREFRKVPAVYEPFDLHWVPEYEALPMYRRAGLPHIHAPMPCWIPEKLRTMPEQESEPPTFIGSADALRRNLLGSALARGADLTVRGPGWLRDETVGDAISKQRRKGDILSNQILLLRRHGLGAFGAKIVNAVRPLELPEVPPSRVAPAVFGDDYFRVTREATVTLGVNRVPVTRRPLRYPLAYSRLRDIEAPMLGACYLTEYTEGVTALYDVGTEVETYNSPEELGEKLSELLSDPQKRASLRVSGQRKALGELTVAASLKKVCSYLGTSIKQEQFRTFSLKKS